MVIERLSEADVQRVAIKFIHAEDMIYDTCGEYLTNHQNDLSLIQDLLHATSCANISPTLWEALGIVMAMVFTSEQYTSDWHVEIKDDFRQVCICDDERKVLFYPESLFHASSGDIPDVKYIYETLVIQSMT